MANDQVGVRIVGAADGVALQAMQAVVSSKAPPEDIHVLVYKPCSDEITMSNFLDHSAKWQYIYPVFDHIADLIQEQLADTSYRINRNQAFFQISICVLFLIAIITTYVTTIHKLSKDELRVQILPIDHVGNFILPIASVGGFLLTFGLACFSLYTLYKNKKRARLDFKTSEPTYNSKRKEIVDNHNLLWAFFAGAELIQLLKDNNLDEIVAEDRIPPRRQLRKRLSEINKRAGKIFDVDEIVKSNGIDLPKELIIANLLTLLTNRSEGQITLGKFGPVWTLIIPKISSQHSKAVYLNNIRKDTDRTPYWSDFDHRLKNNLNTQKKILEIIAFIASQKVNHCMSDIFIPMNLRQRYMPKHIQSALEKHRSDHMVVSKVSDPAVVNFDVFTLKILEHMTDPFLGYRDYIIMPTPRVFYAPPLRQPATLQVSPWLDIGPIESCSAPRHPLQADPLNEAIQAGTMAMQDVPAPGAMPIDTIPPPPQAINHGIFQIYRSQPNTHSTQSTLCRVPGPLQGPPLVSHYINVPSLQ